MVCDEVPEEKKQKKGEESMKERSYVMLKPGFVHLESELKSLLNDLGGKIVARKQFRLNEDVLRQHYTHIVDNPAYPKIQEYMLSGDVVGFVVEGENIIEKIRKAIGKTGAYELKKTDPEQAKTFRGKHARSYTENVVHASDADFAPDGRKNAEIEIERFFGKIF